MRGVAGIGGETAVWGPIVWRVLHDLAEVRGESETGLWEELGRVLPGSLACAECQGHMTAWLATHPLGSSGPRLWMLDAHNAVNARLGRRVWSLNELDGVYRGCDPMMLTLEIRETLRESGLLGAEAVRVIERMVE